MSATRTAAGVDPEKVRDFLERLGFEFADAPHAHFQARGDDAVVVHYRSGKLVVQGKGTDGVWSYLEAMGLVPSSGAPAGASGSGAGAGGVGDAAAVPHAGTVRIGSDECGKGDYFGPMVVVGCRIGPEGEEALRKAGVQDSKRLTDARARALARRVTGACDVATVIIGPEKYNELHARMHNVNKMLAWAHARVIEDLLQRFPDTELAVVDQFAKGPVLARALGERGRAIRIVERPRAESDMAVAAASIVARSQFLSALDRLSDDVGFKLPKGATIVIDAGRRVVRAHGEEGLGRVAKLHFRTTLRVLGEGGGR